jgi:lysophospholipase L1-like esterase
VTHGCFELKLDDKGGFEPVYYADKCYVAGIRRRLNELFPAAAVSVLNAGISGDGSAGGLQRLERDVLAFRPDLVTVNFGLNDSTGGPDGVEAYKNNMREIFRRILDSGAEAMLVTPSFMCSYVPALVEGEGLRAFAKVAAGIQNDGVLAMYVEAAREAAREMGVPIADTYKRWEQLRDAGVDTTALLSNGINHPNFELHELFVEEIMKQVFEA